jgi:hypothetical protein
MNDNHDTPLCGTCEIWFSEDFNNKCPRMSKCCAQAKAFIEQSKNKTNDKPSRKIFDGVSVFDEACDRYKIHKKETL